MTGKVNGTRRPKFFKNRRTGLYLNLSMLRCGLNHACRRRAFKLQNRKLHKSSVLNACPGGMKASELQVREGTNKHSFHGEAGDSPI